MKRFKLTKPDFCFSCGKFSLVSLDNKQAVFACGTKVDLTKDLNDIYEAMTISKFCRDTILKSVDEMGYLVEDEKRRLKSWR